jgi:hypothetical protein
MAGVPGWGTMGAGDAGGSEGAVMIEIDETQKYIHSNIECDVELRDLLVRLQKLFNLIDAKEDLASHDKKSDSYYLICAYESYVRRMISIVEDCFTNINTFSTLAITRHIFEMRVWTRFLSSIPDSGLIFYGHLLKDKIKYWESHYGYLNSEVTLFKQFEFMENELHREIYKNMPLTKDSAAISEKMKEIHSSSSKLDEEFYKEFSIYGASVKELGYDYAAHKIEEIIKSEVEVPLNHCKRLMAELESSLPAAVKSELDRRWVWRDAAKKVGLEPDYLFIYSVTSGILHSIPGSAISSRTKLSISEFSYLLKYHYISLVEIMGYVKSFVIQQETLLE